jgi:hypothetical protein
MSPIRRVLSHESILSHASDLQSTRDIKSAVFPVTIDKSGDNSLGFLVVVCNQFFDVIKYSSFEF